MTNKALAFRHIALVGGAVAALGGASLGALLKSPLDLQADGPQLVLSEPRQRAPTAFDTWVPNEAAPPPPLTEASLTYEAIPEADDPTHVPAQEHAVEPPRADTLEDDVSPEPYRLAAMDQTAQPDTRAPDPSPDAYGPAPEPYRPYER